MENPAVKHYIKFFEGSLQTGRGVDYPVYVGTRAAQYGNGIGDILRGVWRFIFPVVASGASTFLSEAVKAHDTGGGWKSAVKSAIAPAASGMLARTAEKITEAVENSRKGDEANQGGRGRKRKHKKKQYKSNKKQRQNNSNWNF